MLDNVVNSGIGLVTRKKILPILIALVLLAAIVLPAAARPLTSWSVLFEDDFESGDFSAWTNVVESPPDATVDVLSACPTILDANTRGSYCAVAETGAKTNDRAFVADTSPVNETNYKAKWAQYSPGFTAGVVPIYFAAYDYVSGVGNVPRIVLGWELVQHFDENGIPYLVTEANLQCQRDNGTWASTGWVHLPNGWDGTYPVHGVGWITVTWRASSSYGTCQLDVDGFPPPWGVSQHATYTAPVGDNSDTRIDFVRLGVEERPEGTDTYIWFDNFKSWDDE